MKILIVDDELVSRKTMEMIMGDFGELVSVKDGPHAIQAFQKAIDDNTPFELITLDVSMEGMSGLEVLGKLREFENEKQINHAKAARIIMVTSSSDPETVASCIKMGCSDYIVKPFNRKTVEEKLIKLGIIHR